MAGLIEKKVKVGTAAAYVGSTGLLASLQAVSDLPSLLGALPDVIEPFVLALVPAAVTAVAAYQARHTPRDDAAARQTRL